MRLFDKVVCSRLKQFRGLLLSLVRVPVCHTGGRGFESRQPRITPHKGAVAQSGRALESHSRGRGFEPRRLHFCHRSSEVEHSIRNRAVVGSIPTGGLVESTFVGHAGIAQLVERNLAKVEVAGSNPVACLNDSSQHVVKSGRGSVR